jgi:hypothetical protein
MEDLFILKTNIKTQDEKHLLKNVFDSNDQIEQWNLDQHDIDCVLRIKSPSLCYESIIDLINSLGFEGAELE